MLRPLPESNGDEDDVDESDGASESDRKTGSTSSTWGTDKITLHKPLTRPRRVVPTHNCAPRRPAPLRPSTRRHLSVATRKTDITLASPKRFSFPLVFRRLAPHLTIESGYVPVIPAYPLSSTAAQPITLHWSLIRYNPHMSRQCIWFDICFPPRDNIQDFYTGKLWVESDYLKLASKPALDEVRLELSRYRLCLGLMGIYRC